MKKRRRIRRSEATWRELFSRQAASGMRASEFCRREGIDKNVFHRWRAALLGSGVPSVNPALSPMVVVVPKNIRALSPLSVAGPVATFAVPAAFRAAAPVA